MRPSAQIHEALADLLAYPGVQGADNSEPVDYHALVGTITNELSELSGDLGEFLSGIEELNQGEREELYTRTFDNVDKRSLEIGWQLFGENYARGVLMVRFRTLLREHGVEERTELPDHMTHVLRLLGSAPQDLASAFASAQVMQAVDSIQKSLDEIESPWTGVLAATKRVLEMHIPITSQTIEARQS